MLSILNYSYEQTTGSLGKVRNFLLPGGHFTLTGEIQSLSVSPMRKRTKAKATFLKCDIEICCWLYLKRILELIWPYISYS